MCWAETAMDSVIRILSVLLLNSKNLIAITWCTAYYWSFWGSFLEYSDGKQIIKIRMEVNLTSENVRSVLSFTLLSTRATIKSTPACFLFQMKKKIKIYNSNSEK